MLPLKIFVTELLVDHCMPTLMKVKPSSLISVKLKCIPERVSFNEMLHRIVASYDCCYYLLNECEEKLYYIIYQEKLLEQCLLMDNNRRFLRSCGYQYYEVDLNERILEQLKLRYRNYFYKLQEFPHEIGIILGYPLADVEGFINNKGKNFLLCGMWKVYQDVEGANRLFALYRQMKADARSLLQEEIIHDD
jgi:hypothetical protein